MRAKNDFIREAQTLTKLSHPNIVKIFDFQEKGCIKDMDWLKKDDQTFIVLEYITGGELFYHIADYGKLPENIVRMYFQ